MQFLIANTFTHSLGKLAGDEQKAAKTTAFDLQMDAARPSLKFHKLSKARDANFWSVRVNRDIRLIVHRTAESLLLCYVDHHDKAYRWAERRKLETHPVTGAAQLVEVREKVEDVTIPNFVEGEAMAAPGPALLADRSDRELLRYGVPEEWLEDVRQADEVGILAIADHLPGEAAEALLELATGGEPKEELRQVHILGEMRDIQPGNRQTEHRRHVAERLTDEDMAEFVKSAPIVRSNSETSSTPRTDPFAHRDAQRRFRVLHNREELEQALAFPWESWTVFLHPAQRELVERSFNGPARISGSAGTGKTIVALHRAVHLARRQDDARILLTTFNDVLASGLRRKLQRLTAHEPRLAERVEVVAIDRLGERLYAARRRQPAIASEAQIDTAIAEVANSPDMSGFSIAFLRTEWSDVVDAWQLESWETYRGVRRLGRKTRLPEAQRERLWAMFSAVRADLQRQGVQTWAELYGQLAAEFAEDRPPPYDSIVVDEAQDITVPQLRFLAAMARNRPDSLFFAGDLGQRIFQTPFSWKSLGVNVQGRSSTLRINYRTSHQIRSRVDRLLDNALSDVDGNTETRRGTVSVFNGPEPEISVHDSNDAEVAYVGKWLAGQCPDPKTAHELAVLVRSNPEVPRAHAAAKASGLAARTLDDKLEIGNGELAIGTMHQAKGLEFRAVAVMACDDEVMPLQARFASAGDEADLEEIYNTERHLLYVACTRARDRLLVTATAPESEFIDDLSVEG